MLKNILNLHKKVPIVNFPFSITASRNEDTIYALATGVGTAVSVILCITYADY